MWNFASIAFWNMDKVYVEKEKGTRLKGVICENCGSCYAYLMNRVGDGMQLYGYAIDSEDAKQKAKRKAHNNLGRKLNYESDVAPCPDCHYVQSDMLVKAKKIILPWLLVPAIWGSIVLIGGIIIGIIYAYWLILAIAVAVGLFFLLWTGIRFLRFDINSRPDIRNLFLQRALEYGLWTREEVEGMYKEKDCDLDCSYAFLDWEREKLNRTE